MSFTKLMNQTITVFAKGAVNKYGRAPAEGSGTEHKARVDLRTKTRHDAQGNLVTLAGMITTGPEVALTQGQRVDFDGQKFEVVHTYPVAGGNGKLHHMEADIVEYRG